MVPLIVEFLPDFNVTTERAAVHEKQIWVAECYDGMLHTGDFRGKRGAVCRSRFGFMGRVGCIHGQAANHQLTGEIDTMALYKFVALVFFFTAVLQSLGWK